MAKRRTAADIKAAQEALSAELVQLDALEDPTEEQIARSTVALEEYDTLEVQRAEAEKYEARMELVRSAAASPANREPGTGFTPGAAPYVKRNVDPYEGLELVRANRYSDSDVIERAKYAIEQAPGHMSDIARAHVEKLVRTTPGDTNRQAPLIARHLLMTGSTRYHEEFEEFMRSGYAGELLRASMSLTDANGGYLVPFTLDPTIILTNAGIANPFRQISANVQIATDNWNGVTSAGVTAEWLAEAAEAADASPTFAQPTITPKKAAAWVQGSYEVLADSGFASSLGRLLADAKDRLEGAAFATGNTGATVPRGIVAAVAAVTAQIVASATTNALVVGDVYNVAAALRPRDAAQASWIANKAIQLKLRQFDTAGGSAFWANLGMATPPMLLGQPIYEASSMQSAVTTGGLVLLAGNFQEYLIVDRIGMSVQYQPMIMGITNHRPTGQAGWFAYWRVGADVTDVAAFKLLQLNQTAAAVALA